MSTLTAALVTAFGAERVKVDAPLAVLTTFKVGGPADLFFEPVNADEILRALAIARAAGQPVQTRRQRVHPP